MIHGHRVVVDTSAMMSMVLGESDQSWFAGQLALASERLMSAGTVQEFLLVASRRLPTGSTPRLEAAAIASAWALLGECAVEIVPVSAPLALLGASEASRWRSAPARLNSGDGFALALARSLDCPILCKGNDFASTDVEVIRPDS